MAGRKKAEADATPYGRVSRALDKSRDAMIAMEAELVKRNAVCPANGGPGEGDKADWLESWLAANGFPPVTRRVAMDGTVPRPNLYLRIPGRDRTRCLWFMTHLDVVPATEDGWKTDPFTMRVEGDKLVGRGVEDNHQGLVGSVFAAKVLLDQGLEPACDVGLLFVADGETGSTLGIRWLLDHHADLFGPADAFVVPDAGNEDGSQVEVAEKAILWLKFRTVGRQVHASTPNLGKNALTAGSALVVKLRDLYERFDLRDPLFDPPMSTFEATKKDPNVGSINIIPGEDVFYMDCRILPPIPVDQVLAVIRGMCDDVARQNRVVIHLDVVQREDAAPATAPDTPLVQRLVKSVRKVYNTDAKPRGIGGGTVAAHLRRAGHPAAVWSRMDETAHQPNEYVWIANLVGDAKVFADLMLGDPKPSEPPSPAGA
jgi:succinyl-diaminopimelate desuccinylase